MRFPLYLGAIFIYGLMVAAQVSDPFAAESTSAPNEGSPSGSGRNRVVPIEG